MLTAGWCKCIASFLRNFMWMGYLLWDAYKVCVVTWAFPLAWLWACLVLWNKGAFTSWPSVPAFHTFWRAAVARSGPLQHQSSARMLSHCIGITASLEKNPKTKPKNPTLVISPSLWTFLKSVIFLKDMALSAMGQLWLRRDVLHKNHPKLAQLIDSSWSEMIGSCSLPCKGSWSMLSLSDSSWQFYWFIGVF